MPTLEVHRGSSRRCGDARKHIPPFGPLDSSVVREVPLTWNFTYKVEADRSQRQRICKMTGFRSWTMVIANLLVPVGILTFSSGFFPYKPLIPGLATFDDTGENVTVPAVFDKVIFMVVDALRRYNGNKSLTSYMKELTRRFIATLYILMTRDFCLHKGECGTYRPYFGLLGND